MNEKIITVPILNDEYMVKIFISKDMKKTQKLLNKHFDAYVSMDGIENSRARCYIGDSKYRPACPFIIVNMNNCKRRDIPAELTHEGCHAIDWIFKYIGDDNRDELFAHSVTAIVRAVTEYHD